MNYTKKLRFLIFERDGYRCVYCGRGPSEKAILELDHAHPLSKGGTSDKQNLVTSCRDCNRGKSDRVLISYPSTQRQRRPEEYVRMVMEANGLTPYSVAQEASRGGYRLSNSFVISVIHGLTKNPNIQNLQALAFALRRPRLEVFEVFANA